MKKDKRLLCVGWGIYYLEDKAWWGNKSGPKYWGSEQAAINAHNKAYPAGDYEWSVKQGHLLAKKLWVEMKDE